MLARSNAESLLAIVNDLLDISKIEAGKLVLENVDFALRPMLDDSLVLLRERAQSKGIGFVLDVDPRLPIHLCADPTRLRQVLINLVGNAIKFTQSGEVRASVALLPAHPNEASQPSRSLANWRVGEPVALRFEVRDTGIGLSEEARSRLFRKYEQADASTTRKFGGTGLGLSICKQLVDLMGGHIGVDSVLGTGSTFFFELTLPVGSTPVDQHVVSTSSHSQALSVLVAEDTPTNQIIIKAFLEEMGHTAVLVDDGQQALYALAGGGFDLVLMDGRMPVMDGLDATRHVRNGLWSNLRFPDPDIPIVALTANASDEDRQRFLAAGMHDFLTKPISEVELHRAIQRIIDQRISRWQSTRQSREHISPEAAFLAQLDALSDKAAEAPTAVMPVVTPPPPTPSALAQRAAALSGPAARELRERMLSAFSEDAPSRLQEIERAMQEGDWRMAAILTHGIKGSMAYIWPDSPAYHLASRLEELADQQQDSHFRADFESLKKEMTVLLGSPTS
jgi:CheY-like chemotaxis protein/HPt (histidine-containing phosphotransfer) domain-containing protein